MHRLQMHPETTPAQSMDQQTDTELSWASVCRISLPNLDLVQRSLVLDDSKQ